MTTMVPGSKPQQLLAKPAIHSVIDVATGKQDCFTPGGRFILRGRGFGEIDEPSLDTGVYIHGSGAVLQRILRYEHWHDKEIHSYWPEDVAGHVWLFLETMGQDGGVQSTVHRMPIVPASET